jgi:hypothetical protein
MEQGTKEVKRTPAMVLSEIERKLAIIDGISTADAFALGGLVREYGSICTGEAMSGLLTGMIDSVKRPEPSKAPWDR